MDYDKTDISKTYNRGRDLAPEVLQQWMDVVATHLDERAVRRIVDLGCGTGRFSPSLAERFTASVIGIDPSRKMLAEARSERSRAGVFYICAAGEAIPLQPNSVDLIFISMAFHHFTQPQQVAQECARLLCEHGRLFLRTGCRDCVSMYPYVPYFPSSRALIEERLPSIKSQESVFNSAALKTVMSGVATQQIAADFPEYADKLTMKADSILISLDDEEFEAGIRAVRSETAIGPITEPINYVVFEKQKSPAARSLL
jgi:ubiquinone/menaquinone biosynthesis C-methylase UbiE